MPKRKLLQQDFAYEFHRLQWDSGAKLTATLRTLIATANDPRYEICRLHSIAALPDEILIVLEYTAKQ